MKTLKILSLIGKVAGVALTIAADAQARLGARPVVGTDLSCFHDSSWIPILTIPLGTRAARRFRRVEFFDDVALDWGAANAK